MMNFAFLIFFVISLLIHDSIENNDTTNNSYDRNHNFVNELEDQLWTSFSWLSPDQLEVLHDLKADGYNVSELQKELLIFYNITTDFARKNAAFNILNGCIKLLTNFTTTERFEEISKNIAVNISSINVEMLPDKYEMLFLQETNETELVELFMNGCMPIFMSESEEFLSQFDDEKWEKDIRLYDKMINKYPSDAALYKFEKAKALLYLLKVEEAVNVFNEIIALEPNITLYVEEYSDILVSLKRYSEAIKVYDRVLELRPNDIKIFDKKLNALIKHADQSYDKANEIILDKYFKSDWINDTQKHQIKRIKAEGKKASEIFAKYFEFFENLDEKKKNEILHSMEQSCIHLCYAVFGHEKAEEVLALKYNSSDIFEKQFNNIFDNLREEGMRRIASAYMPQCRKILTFDEEMVPRITISPKIDGKTFEFIFDTGASITMANKELWEAIGKPDLHPWSKYIGGVGGKVKPLGRCRVTVEIHEKSASEWLYIVEDGMLLFGRNWIKNFNITGVH